MRPFTQVTMKPQAQAHHHMYSEPYTNHGRFKELGKIGEGAFGEVYVGIDNQAGCFVAIKNVRLMNPSKGKNMNPLEWVIYDL